MFDTTSKLIKYRSKRANVYEEKFEDFLNTNHINQKRLKEMYGDFYLPDFNLVIELKTTIETKLSKILVKSTGINALSFPDEGGLKLEDANKKGKRLQECNDPELNSLSFLCLIDIDKGWDITLEDLLIKLSSNPTMWINGLKPAEGAGVIDHETYKYFLPIRDTDEQQLKFVDYFGILKKRSEYQNWKMQLLENPLIQNTRKLKTAPPFFELYTPTYI